MVGKETYGQRNLNLNGNFPYVQEVLGKDLALNNVFCFFTDITMAKSAKLIQQQLEKEM